MASVQEEGESEKMKRIVRNYVRERLQRKGLHIPGYENEDLINIDKIAETLRRVDDELEAADSHFFDQMSAQLNITPNSALSLFEGIADEIFVSGTNWGRIVAFLTFGSTFAAHCASREDMGPDYVDHVVDWTHTYMFRNLGDWMNQNGGWDGFLDFFGNGKINAPIQIGLLIFAVTGVAVGTLLMMTLK